MLTNEERTVFECELSKLHSEYRKCTNLSLKLQIEEHIALVDSALSHENEDSTELS